MRIRLLEVLGYSCMGGAARSVLELVTELARDDFAVTIAAPDTPGFAQEVAAAGARFVPVAMASRRDLKSLATLERLIRHERFDVVHTHCRNADLHGGIAARLADVPALVAHLRGLLVDGEGRVPTGLVDRIHRAFLSHVPRRIVAISEAVRTHALELLQVAPERVVTVRNGIELTRLKSPAKSPTALRSELGLPPGAPLLLAIGALGRCKGQDLLLDAFAGLRRDAQLALVGEGDARAALERQAEALGVAARVRFLGLRHDVVDLVHAADLFVHPARWEGFGRVVAEAMAAGRPVVATAVGGVPEIVQQGVTGRLVAPERADLLAEVLAELLEDPAQAARLGAAARRFALRELDITATARGVSRVLLEVAGVAPIACDAIPARPSQPVKPLQVIA